MATVAGIMVPLFVLKAVTATVLITFGCYRLWRHRHPRFGGMQVGFRDLTAWSFLMASAHGAGFMVLPWVLTMPADVSASTGEHASHAMAIGAGSPWVGMVAVGVHTAAYLIVMTLAAWVVYRKLGLAFLRTAWFNLDWVWAGAWSLRALRCCFDSEQQILRRAFRTSRLNHRQSVGTRRVREALVVSNHLERFIVDRQRGREVDGVE